jgi:transposase InsO family protein
VVDAVVLEGRSLRLVAQEHGVSKSWVQELVARFRSGGYEALRARSKAPHSVANRTSDEVEDRIVGLRKELLDQGFDGGAHTIHYHLSLSDPSPPSLSTIWRVLKRRGFVTPQPHKRPKSSYIRFEASLPNECWQSDVTFWELKDGTKVEILNFLDDFSRVCVASKVLRSTASPDVVATLYEAGRTWGLPASLLTDNGGIYTAAYRYGFSALESELFHLGIDYKHSRPYHPQTCGKVERFHQTLKRCLDRHNKACSISGLQSQVDRFVVYYNDIRTAPGQGSHDAARRLRLARKSAAAQAGSRLHERAASPPRQGRSAWHGHYSLQEQAASHRDGQGSQREARDPARSRASNPGPR